MTDNTQPDHIVDMNEMVVDNSLDVIFDKMGYTKNTDLRKCATRLITDWHNKQVKNAVATAEDNLDQYWNKEVDKQIEAKLVHISEYAENVTSVDENGEFRIKAIPLSLIAVEINKLKESV